MRKFTITYDYLKKLWENDYERNEYPSSSEESFEEWLQRELSNGSVDEV